MHHAVKPAPDKLYGSLVHKRTALQDLARRFVSESHGFVLVLACLTGIAGGLIASLMTLASMVLHQHLFGVPAGERLSGAHIPSAWQILLWLGLGGLLLGVSSLLWKRFDGSDIVDPIEANALYGGRMTFGGSLFVAAQAAVSNGVGGSVGIEGGFTQLASAAGSWAGRLLNRPREDLRLLVACGAAGAISGAFNAPFAGIAYAFELILAAYSPSVLAPVVLAAIGGKYAASLTAGHGYRIALETDLAGVSHSYLWAIGIGFLSGLFAIALMSGVTKLEQIVARAPLPKPAVTMAGGLGMAALALASPHVMGSGHGGIDYIFLHPLGVEALALIFVFKLAACAVCIGSGFRGGLFSASLFLGGLLGGAAGTLAVLAGVMPISALPGMMVVAMSAFGAAVVGTPLAMAVLGAEITSSIGLMPDILLAVTTATLTVRTLFGYSFSIWRLHVRGSPARSAADIAWARSILMRDVMKTEVPKFPFDASCGEFLAQFPPGSAKRVALVDGTGRYHGLCDAAEVAFGAKSPEDPVAGFARQKDEYLTARQSLQDAVTYFETSANDAVVVVDTAASTRAMGLATDAYVLKRYAQELERRRHL